MFITITHRRTNEFTPDEAAQRLVVAWRLAAKAAKRKYGYKQLPYLVVIERHKSGYPHLHILLRCKWIDFKWLSDQMRERIDSPRVNIQRLQTAAQAAYYVTKYIGKDPARFEGCKRYWRSLDWVVDRDTWDEWYGDKGGGWTVCDYDINTLASRLSSSGYEVVWHDHGRFEATKRAEDASDPQADEWLRRALERPPQACAVLAVRDCLAADAARQRSSQSDARFAALDASLTRRAGDQGAQ